MEACIFTCSIDVEGRENIAKWCLILWIEKCELPSVTLEKWIIDVILVIYVIIITIINISIIIIIIIIIIITIKISIVTEKQKTAEWEGEIWTRENWKIKKYKPDDLQEIRKIHN